MTGLEVFVGVLILVVYTIGAGLLFTAIGSNFGHKASDREVLRRVLLSEKLDDEVKVELLHIINDDIYWKYYEEATIDE